MSREYMPAMIEDNRLGGIIDNKASLDALITALTNAGYGAEGIIRVNYGQEGMETIDPEGIYHHGRIRFIRGMQKLMGRTDKKVLEIAKRALTEGKYAVSVLTDGSDEQRKQVHQIYKANGGHELFFKGGGFTEFLS